MSGPESRSAIVPMLVGAEWVDDQPGGLNRYLRDLLVALGSDGSPGRAVVLGPARSAPVGVTSASHAGAPLPLRLVHMWRAAVRASADADVVDAHFALYTFLPLVVGRLRRLPLVLHFQGPWAAESEVERGPDWPSRIKRVVERMVYQRARTAIALSDAFARILVDTYRVPAERVTVVPPGVDTARFVLGDRDEARSALGLPRGAPIAVAVRRLVARTGIDVLLEAWATVLTSLPDATLVIIGDGPFRPHYEATASRLGLEHRVRFLGKVDEERLVCGYQAADVSVVPTVAFEGFGLIVLESLACGTPVIATDVGGLPEALHGAGQPELVRAGDAAALAARLVEVLSGASPVPSGAACRAVAERFDWAEVARRHREIYAAACRNDRPLRVIYLDHCARLSGGELALVRLLRALPDVDARVVLGEDGPLVERLRRAGIAVEVLPLPDSALSLPRDAVRAGRLPLSSVLESARYVVRLTRRLRALRPDVVHTNSLKAALYGGVASRLARTPVVWHVRDRIAADYLPVPAVRLVRALARVLPHAVIANSRTTLETLGRPRRLTAVVPSPVLPVALTPARKDAVLRIGMVGRLQPWKGQHVFLEAFASAFRNGQADAVIVGAPLFGEDDYEVELHRQASRLGIRANVEFRGFRDDVEAELARLDILVHASVIPEPLGQVVIEGMAAGIAVVAADAGGPAEVVDHGVNGLLAPPGDVVALAQTLRQLANDPELRRRLGEAGRASAARYAPETVAAEVMGVYREVLDRRAGGRRRR